MTGVHQTGVFAEGGVAMEVVAVLDGPMPAVERRQALGFGSVRRQGGHAVGDLGGGLVGLDEGPGAGDAEDLANLGIVDQTGEGVQDLDPAIFDAAMGRLGVFGEAGSGVPVPVDGLQGFVGFGRVALDREQIVGAPGDAGGRGGCCGWCARRPE